MTSKQSKNSKMRFKPPVNVQPQVDSSFDEEVDREGDLHSPQVDDYQTMEPLSGQTAPAPEVDEITADDVSYMLSRHSEIDASDIKVRVNKGEVILSGSVPEERMKFMAAEVIKLIHGVKSVANQLKHSRHQ